MKKNAVISECGQYRYWLRRCWDYDGDSCTFVMLNPSTADADIDDPTIRRCMGFAKDWGFGSIEVVNLFALRATNPKELYKANDPVGPDNKSWVESKFHSKRTIFAWGAHGSLNGAGDALIQKAIDEIWPEVYAMGYTKGGQPKHPLYLAKDCKLIKIG